MGLPAVVIVTEQFEMLARVIMQSQKVPTTVIILVSGKPEFASNETLNGVADEILLQAVHKLTKRHG
jgi:hypothetical protein